MKSRILLPILIVTTAGAIASVPVIRALVKEPVKIVAVPPADKKENPVLKELSELYRRLDTVRQLHVSGTVQTIDLAADSKNVQFTYEYARKGDVAYYRVAESETVALPDVLIAIDHAVKKIFVSAPRAIAPVFSISSTQLAKLLGEEGYAITRTVTNNRTQIALLRENHITCKEFRISYDSSGFIRETFMRMTDLNDPANKDMDKRIIVRANDWDLGIPPARLFAADRYIVRVNNTWEAAAAFKNYELILTQ